MQPCPCRSSLNYQDCCQPLHLGATADSAEALMRSRYSAFSLELVDYLIASHHPSKHSPNDRQGLQQSMQNTRWLNLQILDSEPDDRVEFIATYEENGKLGQLHERSNFVHENGHWYYLDGDLLPAPKISRNDSCPCGSGKKFKKCHFSTSS
ncbi:YchJ family protein [Porticoccus sp. W117]|uniref:YchJ family protein n=1 Tax=Porticoccus sp. W117 TaxID=3054777 RepID=UPI0025943492|nr:YchJ family protein [Porticoccus sp. W117]MDM3869887.1 YchJ family protein [Porticoccus sp. W117]